MMLSDPRAHTAYFKTFHFAYSDQVLISIRSYMLHIQTLRGKLFNRKRKPLTMSEKWHKIINLRIIVKVYSWLGPHCFSSFSKPLIYGFWRNAHNQYTNPLARPLLIALQVVRTSFGSSFNRMYQMGSSSPPPGYKGLTCKKFFKHFQIPIRSGTH